MRFEKGQQVICLSDKNEWDKVVPSLNEMLAIALGTKPVPEKDEICTVLNPLALHYKGKTYISIKGYPHHILDQNGFTELRERSEYRKEQISKRKTLTLN